MKKIDVDQIKVVYHSIFIAPSIFPLGTTETLRCIKEIGMVFSPPGKSTGQLVFDRRPDNSRNNAADDTT